MELLARIKHDRNPQEADSHYHKPYHPPIRPFLLRAEFFIFHLLGIRLKLTKTTNPPIATGGILSTNNC